MNSFPVICAKFRFNKVSLQIEFCSNFSISIQGGFIFLNMEKCKDSSVKLSRYIHCQSVSWNTFCKSSNWQPVKMKIVDFLQHLFYLFIPDLLLRGPNRLVRRILCHVLWTSLPSDISPYKQCIRGSLINVKKETGAEYVRKTKIRPNK